MTLKGLVSALLLLMTNAICTEQNVDRQLDRLAAQRALYSSSKTLFAVHAILSTVVAAGLAVGAMFCADIKPLNVAWVVTMLVLDHLWLTPKQKPKRS